MASKYASVSSICFLLKFAKCYFFFTFQVDKLLVEFFVRSIKKFLTEFANQEVMQQTSKAIIKLPSKIAIVFFIFSLTSVTMLVIYNKLRSTVTGTRRQITEFMQVLLSDCTHKFFCKYDSVFYV